LHAERNVKTNVKILNIHIGYLLFSKVHYCIN